MALLGSVIFNTVFYLSLIPISISIIILYFFLSTKKLQAFGTLWIWFVLWLLRIICGVTWVVEGKENIPDSPCIVVANHQGPWESFYLQTLLLPSTSIIKKELLYIPFFGWALRCMKPITLNRANKFRGLKKVIFFLVVRSLPTHPLLSCRGTKKTSLWLPLLRFSYFSPVYMLP